MIIGRIAGQFAKPRSQKTETVDNLVLPSYKGDLINAINFNKTARTHNPDRMLQAYYHARKALNSINNAIFTSHEALNLYYEQALTKKVVDRYYNTSSHLQWLGARTAKINGPHIIYLSQISNPIGIKISEALVSEELCDIINKLNPSNTNGKICLITRLGVNKVYENLPKLIKLINKYNLNVAWMSDPMHGNNEYYFDIKTRNFNNILSELHITREILLKNNIPLSGIHIEATHHTVTECFGGSIPITQEELTHAYTSLVDPRLNKFQTIELISSLKEQK